MVAGRAAGHGTVALANGTSGSTDTAMTPPRMSSFALLVRITSLKAGRARTFTLVAPLLVVLTLFLSALEKTRLRPTSSRGQRTEPYAFDADGDDERCKQSHVQRVTGRDRVVEKRQMRKEITRAGGSATPSVPTTRCPPSESTQAVTAARPSP